MAESVTSQKNRTTALCANFLTYAANHEERETSRMSRVFVSSDERCIDLSNGAVSLVLPRPYQKYFLVKL